MLPKVMNQAISACERKISMPICNKVFSDMQGDQDSIDSPQRSPRIAKVDSPRAIFELLKQSNGVFTVNSVEY